MDTQKKRGKTRLDHYDYSQDGWYFVTICTWKFSEYFGRIVNGKCQLSKIGKIAEQCWLGIPDHFPNVKLDEYIIMPNHVHGVIIIERVRAAHVRPVQDYDRSKMLLSKIIHGFKSSTTRQIHLSTNAIYFRWQRSFYDHIIRNEKSLNEIREYIRNNPLKWELDRDDPENLGDGLC